MDDRLKELMQNLGNAIDGSLSDSDSIAEAISKIKESGYDVFLILEIMIGYNKRGEDRQASQREPVVVQEPLFINGKLNFTRGDQDFARQLKINLEDKGK